MLMVWLIPDYPMLIIHDTVSHCMSQVDNSAFGVS